MSLSEFIKTAKIYHLNRDEINLLSKYSEQLHIEPTRVLVNRQLFEKIIEAYKRDVPKIDAKFLHTLKEKLNFTSTLAARIENSKDIKEGQKAKFYFDRFTFAPITLQDNQENYLLWKAGLHRNATLLEEKREGTIIFEERYLIAYQFATTISEIYKYADELFIKTPHSNSIKLLAKRRYPRVEVDIEGVVRKSGKLRDNPFYKCRICNISEGGAKICIDNAPFKERDRLILGFKLGYEPIDTESAIEAEITYDGKESYGLKFLNLSEHARYIISKFVASQINKQSKGLSTTH